MDKYQECRREWMAGIVRYPVCIIATYAGFQRREEDQDSVLDQLPAMAVANPSRFTRNILSSQPTHMLVIS